MAKKVIKDSSRQGTDLEAIAGILNEKASAPLKQSLAELEAERNAHTAILACREAIDKFVCADHAAPFLIDHGLTGLARALLGTKHEDSLQFKNSKISAKSVPFVSDDSAQQRARNEVYAYENNNRKSYAEQQAHITRIKISILEKYKQDEMDSDAAQAAITALAMTLGGTSKTDLSTEDLSPIAEIIKMSPEERKAALDELWAERDKAEIAEFAPTIRTAKQRLADVRAIINSDAHIR